MSTIDVASLREMMKSKCMSRDKIAKEERVKECIKTFNDKCDTLIAKYFDETNDKSINASMERAVKKSTDFSDIDLYMNFERDDFRGWAKFVPFLKDEYGRNYNARPASCLRLFLERAKDIGYLPNISFEVWGNKKFTVKFTLHIEEETVQEPELEEKATSEC